MTKGMIEEKKRVTKREKVVILVTTQISGKEISSMEEIVLETFRY